MQKTIFLLMAACMFALSAIGQQKEAAELLVQEGVDFHDKGDLDSAITRFDKALGLDKNNLLALIEKANTLMAQQQYDDVIGVCKKAIKAHPGDKGASHIYVAYGNALDELKKSDESIKVYDKGIKYFPEEHQLYFNKGISLSSVAKYDEALLAFQASATLSPQHASSHNAIARLQNAKHNLVPSLLAYWRFLALEPQGPRGKANLADMQKVMNGNVQQKDDRTINITLDMMSGKGGENNFRSTEMALSMTTALNLGEERKKESTIKKFMHNLEMVCSSITGNSKDNRGFYWAYYVPYFVEMKKEKHLEAFAYTIFSSSEDPEVAQWLKENADKVESFKTWSGSFNFRVN